MISRTGTTIQEVIMDRNTSPVTVVTGTKEALDTANVWARAICHSVLGAVEGEKAYRTLPALPVLLTFRRVMDTIGEQ